MTAALAQDSPRPLADPHRIAFCITDLDIGGAEQCLTNVVCHLDRRVWSPHVYCLSRRGALVDRLEQAGIPCTCLNWRGWPDAWRVLSLARKLRQLRPKLLQTFLFHANIAGRIAGTLAGVPIIVSGIRVANLPPGAVTVIPNGVDVARFADAWPIRNSELAAPPETRWMISVGRLHPQKGHRLLIEAVAPLLLKHPNWRLMIVGDGPLRGELDRQIGELGCRERIVLLGFRHDVPQLLKTSSLFVLPSLWEGQPNAISEAMAAGLPVIASDVEGVRRLDSAALTGNPPEVVGPGGVLEGVTGLIVPPNDVRALRGAIASLLDAPDTLDELAPKTHLLCRYLLTIEGMAGQYADLYASLLQAGPC